VPAARWFCSPAKTFICLTHRSCEPYCRLQIRAFHRAKTACKSYVVKSDQTSALCFLVREILSFFLRRYGAGAVYLVTTSAFNLEETDFEAIAAQITPAGLIDLTYASADLLERTPLQRPAYLAAFLLVLACLVGYSLVVLRAKSKKRMLVLLLATSSILCLSSGFYTNRTKVVHSIYELKTSLYAQTSFGCIVDYCGLLPQWMG